MTSVSNSEIVLPYAAPAILGYTRAEMDVLIDAHVFEDIIHRAGCAFYYRRSELLAFREKVRTDRAFRASIDALLGKVAEREPDVAVLPYAACRILGYTQREMAILIAWDVISYLIHWADGAHYYVRSELLSFRARVRAEPTLAASIEYLLSKDFEN